MTFALIIFPFIWIVILLGVYLLKGYKLKDIDFKLLTLYIIFMAMLGPIGEIFVGTLYQAAFGQPLWQYTIFPTHNGYTSLYAPVIWGISGVFLYCFHEAFGVFKKKPQWVQLVSRTFETITFEALLNVSFFVVSGALIFYYLPGDLFHITSLQTLPLYFILSIILMKTMKRLRKDPVFYSKFFTLILIATVYMTN